MKYRDQRELVEGLRAMADFIEEHIELPIEYPEHTFTNWIWGKGSDDAERFADAKARMQIVARAMGSARKVYESGYFDLRRTFGPITLEFTTNRENVCRRVVKETIHHPEETRVVPARTEEVVEWICDDPILAR